jgi:homoserine O-acetyltransferase
MKKLTILFFALISFQLFAFDELVEKKTFKLPTYTTVEGATIKDVTVGYETYGKLNADKSNVILITHFFSGNSHAAGKYAATDAAAGYWDSIIGPGKPFDTNKYFVISVDTLVNIAPLDPMVKTTGPMSINPKTKKPYGMNFPNVRVTDSVQVQKKLLESLGIGKLFATAGASSGAAQAMEWATLYPSDVPRVIAVVAPGLIMPPYVVALLNRWSAPIKLDAKWNKGNYYGKKNGPKEGLVESLKLITLSSVYFDWGPQDAKEIEQAFEDRASARAEKVDANSLLYTARAIQTYNVDANAKNITAEILFIPAEKDMIFPVEISQAAAKKLCSLGKKAEVVLLKGRGGHLDGLSRIAEVSKELVQFLERPLGSKNPCQ